MNFFRYDPKTKFKHACTVDPAVAYDDPKTGQLVIFLIHQAIEMKDLNHHLLRSMQCCMNSVLIDEVPKYLAPVPSETINSAQMINSFDATHPIIIPLTITGITSYFNVRKPTQGEDEDIIITDKTHGRSSTVGFIKL